MCIYRVGDDWLEVAWITPMIGVAIVAFSGAHVGYLNRSLSIVKRLGLALTACAVPAPMMIASLAGAGLAAASLAFIAMRNRADATA